LLFSQINLQANFFHCLLLFAALPGASLIQSKWTFAIEAGYFFDPVKKRSSSFSKTYSAIYTHITNF